MTAAALYQTDRSPRMPGSAVASIVLHAVVLGAWLYTMQQAERKATTVISGVDIITVRKAVAVQPKQQTAAKPAVSTFDFLKMALPAAPRVAAPKIADVKLPEAHKPMQVATPKLSDRGKLDTGPKLDMDLTKGRSLDAAKVEARIPERKLSALAAMPKLEEVGRRRVANLPAAIAMEERRQEAVALKGMSALQKAVDRRGPAEVAAIQDAAPARGGDASKFSSKIAALLPEQRLDMKQAAMPQPVIKQGVEPVVQERKKSAALQGGDEKKKGVEIEGPIADRKVVNYEIPEFPQWAKDQGVLEASVSIRFWVDKAGDVLPNMRVEHTSGYGRLDRLAMDSLLKWKFAPMLDDERQWGVITFRFMLE